MQKEILTHLLEITIYSAVLLLAVLLARLLLRRWLSPALKYALWFIVLVRLMVPVTLESSFHLISLPQSQAPAAVLQPADPTAKPETDAIAPVSQDSIAADSPSGGQTTVSYFQQSKAAQPLTLWQWLLIAWAAGFALVVLAHLALSLQLNRRIRQLGCPPGERTQALYREVKQGMRIRADVPIVLMADIKSPALTVQLFPKLLIPDRLLYAADREHMAFAMAHELMHYRRRDYLVCLLISLLRAVYWFNPVVWIMPRILRLDMESACDAMVVKTMSREQKLSYVNLLLALAEESSAKEITEKGEFTHEAIQPIVN
ncbi:MAG TPA: M56 family metallopeptidase [Candidatus Cryosericum sp.]|nr:M56 family metallopeptidase [Candidatus Cryosericum sp.]